MTVSKKSGPLLGGIRTNPIKIRSRSVFLSGPHFLPGKSTQDQGKANEQRGNMKHLRIPMSCLLF